MTTNGEHTANQFIVHYLGVIKQDLRVNHNKESVRMHIDPSSHTPLAQKDEVVTTNPRIVEVMSVSNNVGLGSYMHRLKLLHLISTRSTRNL